MDQVLYGIKENADVSLHDCRTNRVLCDGQYVSFFIPDGFYFIGKKDSDAAENRDAEVKIHLDDRLPDGFTVYIYRKSLFGKIVREDWSDRFVSYVNDGRFEFEFVYTYRTYHGILFKGYVWRKKKPWWRECEVEIRTDEITYSRTDV